MNGTLKEKTRKRQVSIDGLYENTRTKANTEGIKDKKDILYGQSCADSTKQIESISVSHRTQPLFHSLTRLIRGISSFGARRIDEQRLASRDPWLEAYHIKRDLW